MERLTEYHNGVAVIKDKSRLKEAMERLAEYENTGLTPEKLVEIDEAYTQQAKELAEYKRAEEQGLLLRLSREPTDEVLNMIYKLCELHSNADDSYDNPKESEMKEAEAKLEELRYSEKQTERVKVGNIVFAFGRLGVVRKIDESVATVFFSNGSESLYRLSVLENVHGNVNNKELYKLYDAFNRKITDGLKR